MGGEALLKRLCVRTSLLYGRSIKNNAKDFVHSEKGVTEVNLTLTLAIKLP